MKILLLDIETSPNAAYVWGLWKQNVAISQLIDSSEVLCFSAKWFEDERLYFDSIMKSDRHDMLNGIHGMLSEADAVVTYNGNRFDLPTLNKEFLMYGFKPPAPYKTIDLLQVARRQFRFPSNKLDYIAQELGLGKKKDTNFQLWVDCMNGNKEAWVKMEEYNKHDVVLLEDVYRKLMPWIKGAANHGLYQGQSLVCPNCGSDKYHRRGYAYTAARKYQRFQCQGCGSWFRSGITEGPKPSEKFTII